MGKASKQKQSARHDPLVDAKASRKILELARRQQAELDDEAGITPPQPGPSGPRFADEQLPDDDDVYEDDEDFDEEEKELEDDDAFDDAAFSGVSGRLQPGQNLADLILAKIQEQQALANAPAPAPAAPSTPDVPPALNDKVVEVYTKVGGLLSRYKSGPLPKAFKILPTLTMWPSLLMLTSPETWTPNATYAATRIFASNLEPRQCQKFYKEILLEKFREEMAQSKKLSVHTYQALKKAIYKPAAFFKGILFPLCESGTCTLREAAVLGSVLSKVSVPVLHSGAALLKLADMEYSGPNSAFIRILLDKKYALPYKVVDALVFHFIRFKRDKRQMPVLWHQSFLVFAQRYKADLTPEQKDALLDVLKAQTHVQITPEIRRELVHSVARGDELGQSDFGMELEVL